MAVASSRTPPMTPFEQDLSSRFDALFGHGVSQRPDFGAGAQLGHKLIVNRYLTHTGPTNWVHFNNIGCWDGGTQVVDRSAITEFCQYCNAISTRGVLPRVQGRRWPMAHREQPGRLRSHVPCWEAARGPPLLVPYRYTPKTVELIPNPEEYVVAGYTPGLKYNSDGSLSIYMSTVRPPGVPSANWLPVSPRRFNVALRIYGTESRCGDHVPPGIQSR